ncbi:hypothetical protein B7463_g7867, partial [Scytalidium lignicola]
MIEWQWDQLRVMKVGGNESATKFFQSNGGTAALNSKDPKTKYTCNAAVKYKEELKRRAAKDAVEYPNEVVVTDAASTSADGSSTPAGEPDDDFFSSWDKPAIKRPTPPISRSGTPSGRTPSPFLNANANGNGIARAPSPLSNSESSAASAPATTRTTSSAVLRKSTAIGSAPRKANVLGAKKVTKLGAKKVGDAIDFDAAERKAKEEAERIEKLGYNPEEEEDVVKKTSTVKSTTASSQVASPTPVSPGRAGYGSAHTREHSASDLERLGMGMGRLGFGQVGGSKPAATQKKMGGFGSVGPIKAAAEDDDEKYARQKFGAQKSISSDEFFGKGAFDPSAQNEAKSRLQGFEGATAISSNAYFGRPEDEADTEDYGDLETAAKDFIRKFGVTAGDDLDNLTQVLGEGATRLQGAIRNYLNG